MQLSAIRTAVRTMTGVDSADALATDANLTSLINSAIREITNLRDWDWNLASETINLVAGTSSYSRAAAARKTVRLVHGTTGESLTLVTPMYATRYAQHTGRPQLYYIEGGAIKVLPVPTTAATLTHFYQASETALSGDTDEPNVPDYAIDFVIVKAAKMLSARMADGGQFQRLGAIERDMFQALADDARRAKGAPVIDSRRDWGV